MTRAFMKEGFTLIELMVVMTIIVVLIISAVPLYSYFQIINVSSAVQSEIVQNLRLAQNQAKAGLNNKAFGIYFDTNQYTLFQGSSYSQRDLPQDIIFNMPGDFTLSGLNETVFAIKTGLPSNTGTIILTNNADSSTKNIIINSIGLID